MTPTEYARFRAWSLTPTPIGFTRGFLIILERGLRKDFFRDHPLMGPRAPTYRERLEERERERLEMRMEALARWRRHSAATSCT